jgi:RND family efflux transporter MFP subunit
VHAWYRDIGARVKKGDVLALIDTPELDQQISQARADVGAAQSAQKLSAVTAERWNSLLPLDAVSKQDAEEKDTDLASKAGATKSVQANLDRLLAMKEFAKITAPFDGVVTKRTIDVGALVSAGPAANGDPLFTVSDIHVLRVYVSVPQSYSAQIVPGMQVTLTVPEYPGKTFTAKLVSTSNAISSQSSTLLVEFEADNAAGLLKPGDYVQVSMGLPGGSVHLRLPASTLMFRAEGLRVATVGTNNRVLMKPITIETDLGTQVVVAAGLSPRDRVVDNPPDSLGNGDEVRVEGAGHAD